jgi:hypothetical protein
VSRELIDVLQERNIYFATSTGKRFSVRVEDVDEVVAIANRLGYTDIHVSPTSDEFSRVEVKADYERKFDEDWAGIVLDPKTGAVNLDQVKRELSDYSFLLEQVPIVYDELTNGRLSKTTYHASTIVEMVRDIQQEDMERWQAPMSREMADLVAIYNALNDGDDGPCSMCIYQNERDSDACIGCNVLKACTVYRNAVAEGTKYDVK